MRTNNVNAAGRKRSEVVTSTTTQQDLETLLQNYLDGGDNSYVGNSGNSEQKKKYAKKNKVYNDSRDNESEKYTRELYKYLKVLYTLVGREIKRIDKRRVIERRSELMTSLDDFNSK